MGQPKDNVRSFVPSNHVQKQQIKAIEALADLAQMKVKTTLLEIKKIDKNLVPTLIS